MSGYVGDFAAGSVVRIPFNTNTSGGAPITLAGTPSLRVYKDSNPTESTTGVSLTVDWDSLTGTHYGTIDTSTDGTFYSAGSDFAVVIAAGTVNGTSVSGAIVGTFSIANRFSGTQLATVLANQTTINNNVLARLATTGYTAPDNASIASIKAKTDNLPASPAAIGSAMTLANNSVTNNAIADGAITSAKFTVASVTGVASGILEKIDQTWRRFFKKATKTSTQIKTFADDGSTVLTTQSATDDGTTETQGAAS